MSVTSDTSRALAERWFQKAENDLLNVANNLKAERCKRRLRPLMPFERGSAPGWGWSRKV
jgi:hypothetical protein